VFGTAANALGSRLRRRAIDTASAGNLSSVWFAVSRDLYFFTPLYPVQ